MLCWVGIKWSLSVSKKKSQWGSADVRCLTRKVGDFSHLLLLFFTCSCCHMKHENRGRYSCWGGLRRAGSATTEASSANPDGSLMCWSTRGKKQLHHPRASQEKDCDNWNHHYLCSLFPRVGSHMLWNWQYPKFSQMQSKWMETTETNIYFLTPSSQRRFSNTCNGLKNYSGY